MEEKKYCKNCGTELIQRATKPKASQLTQPYYYTAYYSCPACGRLYHDEKFKVVNEPLFEHAETQVKNVASHPHLTSPLKGEESFLKSQDTLGTFDTPDTLQIWTDGACVFNGQPNARAAWSFVSGETERAGLVPGVKQTNNVAEALAVYHALLWAVEQGAKEVTIYSDSHITLHNLKKDPLAIKNNQEIFQMIADVISANGLSVDYEKVPGHADNVNNNRADKLANGLAAGQSMKT
jgi:ribonuclease HI